MASSRSRMKRKPAVKSTAAKSKQPDGPVSQLPPGWKTIAWIEKHCRIPEGPCFVRAASARKLSNLAFR